MNKQQNEQQHQNNFTPINYVYKPIQKTTVPRNIFNSEKSQKSFKKQLKYDQSSSSKQMKESSKLELSRNQSQLLNPHNFKKSQYINEQDQQIQKLRQKLQFLEHCLNQYKLQALSLSSKLNERQRLYRQFRQKYEEQIQNNKIQINNLQKQLSGQNKLIQQCHINYDESIRSNQSNIRVINDYKKIVQDLNIQISILQRAVNSTRQVSVNLIKQNEDLKAEMMISREKYQILSQDYQSLDIKYENMLRQLTDENRLLVRKVQQMDMSIKIFEKDKQIQKLLIYQDSIQKRQKDYFNNDKNSSCSIRQNKNQKNNNSPYQYIPRRLNFEQQTNRTNKKVQNNRQNQINSKQIIQLQKSKILNLQNQIKNLQKRNKQLQSLIVKFMK